MNSKKRKPSGLKFIAGIINDPEGLDDLPVLSEARKMKRCGDWFLMRFVRAARSFGGALAEAKSGRTKSRADYYWTCPRF